MQYRNGFQAGQAAAEPAHDLSMVFPDIRLRCSRDQLNPLDGLAI
jgi:hypothetical protein